MKPYKKKGDKALCDSSSTISRLLPLLERWHLKPEDPFFLIFRLYKQLFLNRSIHRGLISLEHLALASALLLSAPPRNNIKNESAILNEYPSYHGKRLYSQPDYNWVWDFHRECYFSALLYDERIPSVIPGCANPSGFRPRRLYGL